MKKLTKLSFPIGVASLMALATNAFAASFADDSQADSAVNNQAANGYYVNVGANDYHFDLPNFTLPVSSASNGLNNRITSTTSGVDFDNNGWAVQPGFAIGYQFDGSQQPFANIFGEQISAEFRYSYAHLSDSGSDTYSNTYINPWYITGGADSLNLGNSFRLNSSEYDYDDTYHAVGLYYIGHKLIRNKLVSSPYVGANLFVLEQDDSYSLSFEDQPLPGGTEGTTGSDDVTSYYYGVEVGDKLTLPIGTSFSVFGDLGLSLLGMHNELDAEQVPNSVTTSNLIDSATYKVSTTEDKAAYRAKLEVGANYYLKGMADPKSIYVSLLGGAEYWSDVAYADNPTDSNTRVGLAYDDSLSYYAGLQVHVPLD